MPIPNFHSSETKDHPLNLLKLFTTEMHQEQDNTI